VGWSAWPNQSDTNAERAATASQPKRDRPRRIFGEERPYCSNGMPPAPEGWGYGGGQGRVTLRIRPPEIESEIVLM